VGLIGTLDLRTAPGTWIVHGLLTLAAGLILALLFVALDWGDVTTGYVLGMILVVVYLTVAREPFDRLRHKLKGDYDEEQGGATPRADFVGDILAPWALLVGSIVGLLL
jgi:hypothetical protein